MANWSRVTRDWFGSNGAVDLLSLRHQPENLVRAEHVEYSHRQCLTP